MNFDPAIIETFARRLYSRASLIVLKYGLLYALIGGVVGAVLYYYLPAHLAHDAGGFIVLGTMVPFTLVGMAIGNEKAFNLRLQAQLALCQLQMERNTRATAEISSASAKAHLLSLEAVHLNPPANNAASGV